MPRPSECTPARVAAIVGAYAAAGSVLRRPVPLLDALAAAGLGKSTYYEWRARAAGGDEPFASAVAQVEAARRAHLAPLARRIARLARGGTKEDATRLRAATWLLERLGGEAWNPPSKTELSGPEGGPLAVTIDPAALLEKIRAIAARRRAAGAAGDAGGDPGGAEPGGAGGARR